MTVEPLLGPRQPFPQRCNDCAERFGPYERVVMLPSLREAEPAGRVLWYVWLCRACAAQPGWFRWLVPGFGLRPVQVPATEDDEPHELRQAREAAERQLTREAAATRRARRQWGHG